MKIWNPKTRILLPAIGALSLLGLGGAALAKPAVDGASADRHRGGLCAKLECTDQQKEELKAVMTELREDTKGDREAIRRLHGTISKEFAKARPDEKAMRAAMAQIETHERELKERGFDAVMEIHALLTPEQRAKVAKAMEHRGLRGLMGGRGGKGKRGGKAAGRAPDAKAG